MSAASHASALPPDIVSYLAQLDEADRRGRELVAALTDAQANWQPHSGAAWSVAQCLDHMAVTTTVYLSALRSASAGAGAGHRTLQPAGWFSRFFLKKTEPPVSTRIKAPKNIQPPSSIPKADALAHFLESNKAVRTFVEETAHLDLCHTRFRNPFVRILPFTIATGLLVIAGHNRRHLWQAEQVTKDPQLPR